MPYLVDYKLDLSLFLSVYLSRFFGLYLDTDRTDFYETWKFGPMDCIEIKDKTIGSCACELGCPWMGERISMSISSDSPRNETLH